MKFSIISLAAAVSVANATTLTAPTISSEFKAWMVEHSKVYNDIETLLSAHKTFSSNLKVVDMLSADREDTAL